MRSLRKPPIALVVFALGTMACSATPQAEIETTTTAAAPSTTAPTTTTTEQTTTTTLSTTTTAAPDPLAEVDWNETAPDLQPVLTLIDPGSEPLAVRVWSPERGEVSSVEMVLDFSFDQTFDETPVLTEARIVLAVDFEVVEVSDEGFVLATTVTGSSVTASDSATVAALEETYAAFEDVALYQRTSADGRVLATGGLRTLPDAETLTDVVGGVVLPLPTEPIGPGAVWEVDGVLITEEITFFQTTTARLIDVSDGLISIELEIDQEVDPDSPALAELSTFEITGSNIGTATWDLARGFPVSASTLSTQTFDAVIPTGAGTTSTLLQITTFAFELAER